VAAAIEKDLLLGRPALAGDFVLDQRLERRASAPRKRADQRLMRGDARRLAGARNLFHAPAGKTREEC
jgi:hypothetical protein